MEEVTFGAEPWKMDRISVKWSEKMGREVVVQYSCLLHSAWHE